jgi:hypothetical protein
MQEMLDFLRQHPAIATQFETYLTNLKQEVREALSVPQSYFEQAEGRTNRASESVVVVMDRDSVDAQVTKTLASKHESVHGAGYDPNAAFRQAPAPPAKGKALKTSSAFRYFMTNIQAFRLVHDEAFSQINVGEDDVCWDLKSHVKVFRNDKGALVKRVQIHHLGKPLPAVQLVFALVNKRISDENLYNKCGNDRCVNPHHHTEGRVAVPSRERKAARNKQAVWATPEMKFERTQENLETILEFMEKDPEKGVVIEELQRAFVVPSASPSITPMTLDELTDAMRLGVARSKFYNRQFGDKRIFLKGYPSVNRVEAANQALRRAGESL